MADGVVGLGTVSRVVVSIVVARAIADDKESGFSDLAESLSDFESGWVVKVHALRLGVKERKVGFTLRHKER